MRPSPCLDWRVARGAAAAAGGGPAGVAAGRARYLEGFHSLPNSEGHMGFDAFDRGASLGAPVTALPAVQRGADSLIYFKLSEHIEDLLT